MTYELSSRMVLAAGLAALLCPAGRGQVSHTALLPRVQQIAYGQGSVSLCGLAAGRVTGEDAMAGAELERMLAQRCPGARGGAGMIELIDDHAGGALPGVDDRPAADGRESYSISVRATGVTLHGRSSAGLFYAVETLRQMVEGPAGAPVLPLAEVRDWPSLPYRGFMMDMSHGGVPTVAEVERQLDALAGWKANQYFFYTETTLDMDGYRLPRQASNWSKEDVRTIVEYARERHIDVVPCVELYGHLHDLFAIERYSGMSALPHGGEANPANKEVQALLEDWLRQYAALFPSPWLHLGFDEPFELGQPGSATGGMSPDALWLNHLEHLAKVAAEAGKRPLFWADIDEGAYIFNKYPGLATGLPKGAIAAPWFYDARPDYTNLLDLFAKNKVPILVTTGISDWDNVTPDYDSTWIDIDGFLAAGRRAGTLGMLNTEWSDSALALHRQALPALAYGAVAAWQAGPVNRAGFFHDYARLRYAGEDAGRVARALDELAKAQTSLRQALGPETSFRMWDDPFHASTLVRVRKEAASLRAARLAAEEAEDELSGVVVRDADGEVASLLVGARMLDYAALKFLYAGEIAANFEALPEHPTSAQIGFLLKREMSARNHSRVGDLLDTAGELERQYADEWLREYKPYRLATAEARWRAEQEFWRRFQAAVWTVARDFKEGDARPTLAGVLAVR